MPGFWLYLKKSLHCKPHSSEFHDPKASTRQRNAQRKNESKSIIEDGKCVKDSRSRSTKQIAASKKTRSVDCEKQKFFDTTKEHDFSEQSVIQLHRQDSSRHIIEKICEANYVNGETKTTHIECVLKVQNTPETFARFEECREMVKYNVERLQNKYPRCMVDGNELLRFYGTTIACSLGVNDSSTLCTLDQCGVCQILRHGFSANHKFHGTIGVFTTSSCEKAIDSIRFSSEPSMRKCVIVCRVIAGRINNPLQEIQEMSDSGYDSLVNKMSGQSDIKELSVLNPAAVLPCFVVISRL